MKRRLAILGALALTLTGCSSAGATPDIIPAPAPAVTLATTADDLGCSGYVQSPDVAPFAVEWGTCTFDGTEVQAYSFATADDYAAFLESVRAYGITDAQLVTVGTYAFAPRDQTRTAALRAAAGL